MTFIKSSGVRLAKETFGNKRERVEVLIRTGPDTLLDGIEDVQQSAHWTIAILSQEVPITSDKDGRKN